MVRKKIIRPNINSAQFNLREVTKQLLLLEDHLSDDDKYCVDCIRKHMMMVEALSDEAIQMDPGSYCLHDCRRNVNLITKWMTQFNDGRKSAYKIAQDIRKRRKDLIQKTFDPRV